MVVCSVQSQDCTGLCLGREVSWEVSPSQTACMLLVVCRTTDLGAYSLWIARTSAHNVSAYPASL
jgi:hypothetical protein